VFNMIVMKTATGSPGAYHAASPQVLDRRLLPSSLRSWGEFRSQQGGVGTVTTASTGPVLARTVLARTVPTSPVRHKEHDPGISAWRPPV